MTDLFLGLLFSVEDFRVYELLSLPVMFLRAHVRRADTAT
jgi:hypothetical protein